MRALGVDGIGVGGDEALGRDQSISRGQNSRTLAFLLRDVGLPGSDDVNRSPVQRMGGIQRTEITQIQRVSWNARVIQRGQQ
ncbi:hypothetical protein D3C84_1088290 [compost metagenome]